MTADAVYLDSSALVKLVVREPETASLEAWLQARSRLTTTKLARTEVIRSIRPFGLEAIAIGKGVSKEPPGSMKGLQLVVDDIDAAYKELTARGIEVSEPFAGPGGKFMYFSDPDGNGWSIQDISG